VVTAFKKIDGVSDVDADCGGGVVKVTFDPKKTNVDTLLKDGLKGTKYTASKVEEDKDKKGT
jgi:copper chaperone CopZ